MRGHPLLFGSVVALVGFWALTMLISTLYAVALLWRGRRRGCVYQDPYLSFPISILKPLKGLEDNLEENLEAFFQLDYPLYEILFSVSDASDPVCVIVQALLERYPDVEARLIVGGPPVGENPKINNLVYSYQLAQHDYVLICDSSVRPDEFFLRRMASYCAPGVGLVTAAIAGVDGSGLGGWLEALYLNTFYLRWTYLGRMLHTPVIAGKAMLFRRSTADRFGGLKSLSPYLAEDFMLARAIQKLGLGIAIMHEPVLQEIGDKSFSQFWARHLRWGRIRKAIAPAAFVLEGASSLVFLIGCLLCLPWETWPLRLEVAATVGGFWAGLDFLLWWALGFEMSFGVCLAWGVRECLSPLLWLHTLCGTTVVWRGARLRLGRRTRLLSSKERSPHLRLAPR